MTHGEIIRYCQLQFKKKDSKLAKNPKAEEYLKFMEDAIQEKIIDSIIRRIELLEP